MLRSLHHIALGATLTLAAAAMQSCSGVINDYEGDCEVRYALRFRYDRNIKFADAFPSSVRSVKVYAYDHTSGQLAAEPFTASGMALATPGFELPVELPAGTYDLVAWCGLEEGQSFAVNHDNRAGTQFKVSSTCRMARTEGPDGPESAAELNHLYHGVATITVSADDEPGTHYTMVPLTKDTNDFHIMLQQVDASPMREQDFEITITDHNGLLAHDNTPVTESEPVITYRPYSVVAGTVESEYQPLSASRADQQPIVSVLVAHFRTSRLHTMTRPMLTVTRKTDGRHVFSIPVQNYLLLVKGKYIDPSTNRELTNQEYLDYQDDHSMTFFIDENYRWLNTTIIVNSWRLVIQDVEFQ